MDFGVDSGDISRIFLRFWSHFEVILCNFEALGALGCSWGGLGGSWGSLGRPWGAQVVSLEPFWSHFGVILESF